MRSEAPTNMPAMKTNSGASAMKEQGGMEAVADLGPTASNTVHGVVTFKKEGAGIRVVADIEGLAQGEHGFHLHEKGDCSAPDGASAGGHFNPTHAEHGAPDNPQHHLGDLGNIIADAAGKAHLDRLATDLTFEGTNSIIGKAVIVHAKNDDLKSQPAGNAGARVACGVIKKK